MHDEAACRRETGRLSMLPAERHSLILEHLQSARSVKIEELASLLKVSEATVRRDLTSLATKGLVSRTHGGAILPTASTAFERLYPEKRMLNQEEKRRIGAEAAALVADGETIILDSGSTTFEIARNLARHKNLTLITNDLFIAGSIAYDPSTTVIVTGGVRREGFNVLVGPVAEEFLRNVNVNRSFLAADAIDFEHGVTNATFIEVAIKQLIIAAAREVVLVADHTKFGSVALVKVCSLDRVHRVITDSGLAEPVMQGLQRLGIPVTAV
ncbi:MAG: DeoR/GlpR family DNA-binding transcription regulator [Betaproteobacteria bacterium]